MNDAPPPLTPLKTSGLAIASMVLGIFSVGCCGLFVGIVAIILGHVAYAKIRKPNSGLKGEGFAIAGFVMGYVSFFTTFILMGLALPAIGAAVEKGRAVHDMNNGRQIAMLMQQLAKDGADANDKSLGLPADAGITSVSQLKKLLIEKGYLDSQDAEQLHFENFLIGNVSASDSPDTIIIRSLRDRKPLGSFAIYMNGEGQMWKRKTPFPENDPPRSPPYLAP